MYCVEVIFPVMLPALAVNCSFSGGTRAESLAADEAHRQLRERVVTGEVEMVRPFVGRDHIPACGRLLAVAHRSDAVAVFAPANRKLDQSRRPDFSI